MAWFDLHRHDEFSSFDGFGKAVELAKLAKEYGYPALGISNHGNTNGLVQHYMACKANGIKPVLGVEGYMLPKYKEKNRGFHLCLFAKNQKGYRNINELQYEGEKQKYYNPIWTFKLLEKYSEGVICTSACIAGYLGQAIKHDRVDLAEKFILKMQSIYGGDFYLEVQPYSISEAGLQEKVNSQVMLLGDKLGVKVVLTSDSHYTSKEDFPTYLKMHEIAGHDLDDITRTYKERYMPTQEQIEQRFLKMHPDREKQLKGYIANSQEICDKVEEDIFAELKQTLPPMQEQLGVTVRSLVRQGLKAKGKWTPEYKARVKEELEVIETLGFDDYFLMVYDYVNWAKSQGINVGPGRGSCCNCEVAYALGITEVDSLYYGLDFRRFLRIDKKKMPDIDLDFEKSRRGEVINYIINRYPGHTARIASYGLYKVDNLINDLAKVCGLDTKKGNPDKEENEATIKELKEHIKNYIDEENNLLLNALLGSDKTIKFNRKYDNICIHFSKLYQKMRFIGTHAAGVAITGGNILDYTSLRIDSKTGELYTNYDLNDLENIHVIKFDILGLATMEEIGALRKSTGVKVDYEQATADPQIIRAFANQGTIGIFQFDKPAVQKLLKEINCSCFEDIVAANAINRPGPLSTGIPQLYAYNKAHPKEAKKSLYYPYTQDTFGTIVYQEQIQKVCVEVAGMSWGDADKVMKMIGGQSQSEDAKLQFEKDKKELGDKFVKGAIAKGIDKKDAKELFNHMLVYSFNKGHALGYSLISVEEMFYKQYYPTQFWWAKLKYCPLESNIFQLEREAVSEGNIILLPHINGTANYSLKEIDGEICIQRGLTSIKGIGQKIALIIEQERLKNGDYKDTWDLQERIPQRLLNNRIFNLLEENGALEWDMNKFYNRTVKMNSSLLSKSYSKLR